MRPNASGTTRANTSLTIGSLNDRKIFVTRSSAGSITCGTIHKRSKAYFVLFFNSHVELLMRAYIASAVPVRCAPVERKRNYPWRWEPCGILRPRRTHPEIDTDGYASNDLNQRMRELGFRAAQGVVRRNGHFQIGSGGLHREYRQGCGGREVSA